MTAGKLWVRHFFPLTCNLKVVSQDVEQNKILLFILMLYIKALTASSYVNLFPFFFKYLYFQSFTH